MKVLVCLSVLVPAIFANVVPEDEVIGRCMDVSREELEPCIIKLVNEMQPSFEEGLPEFNLPSMREVDVDSFNVSEFNNENNYLKLALWDLVLKGLEEVKLDSLRVDYEDKIAHAEFTFPEVFAQAKYVADAVLSLIPINGQGTMWTRMKGIAVTARFKFSLVGDDHHMTFEATVDTLNPQDVTVRLNNLYKDNPILKEAAEAFINASGQELLDLIRPDLMKILGKRMTRTFTEMGTSIPLEKLAGQEDLKKAFNL